MLIQLKLRSRLYKVYIKLSVVRHKKESQNPHMHSVPIVVNVIILRVECGVGGPGFGYDVV